MTDTNKRPEDFQFKFEWDAESIPPPDHYEYRIHCESGTTGGIVFYPDYPGKGVPEWVERLTFDDAALDALHALMTEKNIFREDWSDVNDLPTGGGTVWVEGTTGGRAFKVPSAAAEFEDIVPVYQAIRALVPEEIWKALEARRVMYAENYEKERNSSEEEVNPPDNPAGPRRLRLWPGIILVTLQWLLRFVVPEIFPNDMGIMVGVFGALLLGPVIAIWWVFFSRAARIERWGGAVMVILGMVAGFFLIDKSISAGMQGMMYPVLLIPLLSLAFVAWAAVSRRLSSRWKMITMGVAILLACGGLALVRSNGITGDLNIDFVCRWTATAEEELMSAPVEELMPAPSGPPALIPGADWPGFRGADRDSIARGLEIATDWTVSLPVELWRRAVGPGCSSFAIRGGLVYTQEQRGEDELVSCYDLETGRPVWMHADKARFWDSHAGAGPRSTPVLAGELICTIGATGIVNVLNARDGTVVWSRNAVADTGMTLPGWAIAGSPLVVDDSLIVAVVSTLIAYDLATGEQAWIGPAGPEKSETYVSPHLLTLGGVRQVVQVNTDGAIGVVPADGTVLWEYPWPSGGRIVQPAVTPDGDLLLSWGGMKKGLRRLMVTQGPGGWKLEEIWTSRALKPYFNDTVIHKGHAYGFDGPRLACMDLKDGARKWKGSRYAGFSLLLPDQDLLLVLSEKGELALVEAVPDKYTELGRFQAIKGKTWNVPALAGDILLVRNAIEMAAFRLPSAGR